MTIYNLYIFDRNCTCLYYKAWVRHKEAGISQEEEFKLMYGMIFSIKSLISRLSIKSAKEGLVGYTASNYKLHYFETPTGYKFVMNTDTSVDNIRDVLRNIYARIFVEYVVRNPLLLPGNPVESDLFTAKLDEYVQSLHFKPGSRLTMLRKMGLCGRPVFQIGREPICQQRTRVAVDCSLDHHMTHKRELESLVKQIKLAYVANLRAPKPFQLYLTGLGTGSRIHNALNTRITDFHSYQIEVMEDRHDSVFDPQDIVYLTSDASTDLEGLDSSKVYVIGGIVDLTINKRLTLHRARLAGLKTARLPIATYMESTTPTPHSIDLPLNIVTEILLDVHSGKGWPSALHAHLPKRKGFRLKSGLAISEPNTSTSNDGTKWSCKA